MVSAGRGRERSDGRHGAAARRHDGDAVKRRGGVAAELGQGGTCLNSAGLWGLAISSLSKYSTEVSYKHSTTVRRASHAAVAPAGCDGWHADGGASGASISRCRMFAISSRRSAEVARLLSIVALRAQWSA